MVCKEDVTLDKIHRALLDADINLRIL